MNDAHPTTTALLQELQNLATAEGFSGETVLQDVYGIYPDADAPLDAAFYAWEAAGYPDAKRTVGGLHQAAVRVARARAWLAAAEAYFDKNIRQANEHSTRGQQMIATQARWRDDLKRRLRVLDSAAEQEGVTTP